jgi:2OG-Fe(II) oxygenase superfamily
MNEYNEHEDFIRVYDNAVSTQFCQGLIDYFEWCNQNNKTWSRHESTSLIKADKSTNVQPTEALEINFVNTHLLGYIKEFNESFWNVCYKNYREEFDALNSYDNHSILCYKVQKTLPKEGYHVWHCENGPIEHARRIGVYILYLNDVIEGGETEFLYQGKRVQPREGTLVIFPSSYTHVHRGNPPLKGVKYILTGWIELV